MFGEGYDNAGGNNEFRPSSPNRRDPLGTGRMGSPRGSSPAAVAVASTFGGGGSSLSVGRAYGDVPNVLRENDEDSGREEGPGAGAPGSVRVKSVAQIVAELDADRYISGPKGGCCSRVFVPFFVVLLLVVVLLATVWGSGTSDVGVAVPRVALFIVEGFTGPAFQALVQSEQHLPNIASLMGGRGGVHAHCPDAASPTCARSVVVEDETVGSVRVFSGSSMASILTGVSPRLHGVRNDTLGAYAEFATTSNTYPSLAKRVTDANGLVTVIGTSHLLNSLGAADGRCSRPGVLDMECAASREAVLLDAFDAVSPGMGLLECLASSTCNAHIRKIRSPTNASAYSDGHGEVQFMHQLKEIFGGLELSKPSQKSATQNVIADNVEDSLFIFHFDSLAVRTDSADLPEFQYSASSPSYVAEAYLIDAMIGQAIAFIKDRANTQKENWLVVGLADHGGQGKSFATTSSSTLNAHQAIAFFMSTFTTNAKGYVRLKPLATAVSQLDVVPTVLRWLNLAPFDDATQRAVEDANEAYSDAVEEQLAVRRVFEGQVRGICSSGLIPVDCV